MQYEVKIHSRRKAIEEEKIRVQKALQRSGKKSLAKKKWKGGNRYESKF